MTPSEAERIIEQTIEQATPRIVAHVLRLIEMQCRELAAAIHDEDPMAPADAALLLLADDLRLSAHGFGCQYWEGTTLQ